MRLTKSGLELKDVIQKAIKDHVITTEEYDEIMKAANQDGIIDDHEQRLLTELQKLIADGSVKRDK
jgi:hypothetical protein